MAKAIAKEQSLETSVSGSDITNDTHTMSDPKTPAIPYVLYGTHRSGSLTVELALAEIGADYEVRDVDLGTNAQRDAAYATVNPQRKIPALITPAGETLTESVAILLTLNERHPEAGLLPRAGSAEQSQALRWLLFVATELYPLIEINDYPERFAPDPESAPALREIVRALWRERWLLVEHGINGDPFLLSAGFSLSDIYIAVISRWGQQDVWRPSHIPAVERLAAAVAARPVLEPVWRRHWPEPAGTSATGVVP